MAAGSALMGNLLVPRECVNDTSMDIWLYGWALATTIERVLEVPASRLSEPPGPWRPAGVKRINR